MNVSKLDFISAQTRSRIIKLITYLSKGEFKNFYEPRPVTRSLGHHSNTSNINNNIIINKNNHNTNTKYEKYEDFEYNNHNNQNPPNFTYNKNPAAPPRNNNNFPSKTNTNNNAAVLNDFVSLLSPENSKEMLVFSLQNLAPLIEDLITSILDSKEAYLQLLNLIEINVPADLLPSQIHILNTLNENLQETRALDGLQNKLVPRVLKAFSLQPSKLQPVLYNLLSNHLSLGKFRVDVPTIIAMISCPFLRLQDLGAKILAELSDPNTNEFNNYDLQFENHVKFLLETSLSKKKSYEFKNAVLSAIANLCLKDSL
ncbi:MAG: hypothetical protein KDK38_15210, partial [Leptospiraceae bacterium]|nr:hypothetical protein [Leptospiraceae bacterium]